MTKSEEKKLIKSIHDALGNDAKLSDDLLIYDLIDWLKISERAKEDLQTSIRDEGLMGWQSLTTISMCSKNIQTILTKLNLTPEKRVKKETEKPNFDFSQFLKGEDD